MSFFGHHDNQKKYSRLFAKGKNKTWLSRSVRENMEPLPGNWSICVASVFEDAVDQLSILGSIVPSQRKSKNTYQQIADEITEILTEQKKLESEFDESAISDTTRTIKQLTTDLIG